MFLFIGVTCQQWFWEKVRVLPHSNALLYLGGICKTLKCLPQVHAWKFLWLSCHSCPSCHTQAPRPHMARFEHKNQLTLTFGFAELQILGATSNITITVYHCHHHACQYASWCTIIIRYPHLLHHDMTCSWECLILQNFGHTWQKQKPRSQHLQSFRDEFLSCKTGHFCPTFHSFHPNLAKNRLGLGSLQRRWPQELCNSGLMTLRRFCRCKKRVQREGCVIIKAFGMSNDKTSQTLYDSWWSWWSICKNTQAHTQHTNMNIQVYPMLKSW